jgi:ribonuclease D
MTQERAQTPVWVNNTTLLAEMVEKLLQKKVFGIDTEFIRETTFFPKIALIQVATEDLTWLVDPLAFSKEQMTPFTDVLLDPGILKIMHAAYGDQECLFWSYGIIATPVIDTAIAAALTGYGDNIGLGKLVREVLNVHLPKGRARVKWLARPLSRELLHYAAQDVAHLVELSTRLEKKLKAAGRWEWALDESAMSENAFDESPAEIAGRLAKNGSWDGAGIAALERLVGWREKRARHSDIPRGWVADNEVLVALARVRPHSLEEMHSFRGFKPKEVERSGNMILEMLRDAEKNPVVDVPTGRRGHLPAEYDEHAVELLKAFVALLSARLEIATRFLLPQQRMLPLLHQAGNGVESWVESGLLTISAAKLIGNDLKEFLNGSKGLALKKGRVHLIDLGHGH